MDSNNFVAPEGNGFVVYVNGQRIGWYATQSEAEQAYNSAQLGATPGSGGSTSTKPSDYGYSPSLDAFYEYINGQLVPKSGTAPGSIAGGYYDPVTGTYSNTPNTPAGSGGGFDWSGLWEGLIGSNKEQFDWQKELAKLNLAQQDKSLWAQLLQGLLGTGASLTGPADWLKYAQYTTGGQNILDRLWGDAAAPAFGAPTGFSETMTLEQLLRDMGLIGDGTDSGTTGMYDTVNGARTVQQMREELKNAGYPNWQTDDDAAIVAAYAHTTRGAVTPQGGTGSTTTGQYQTVNGVRTVQQMRDELKAAGYPNWQTDNDAAIVAAYAHTTKGQVTPYTSAASQPTSSVSATQAALLSREQGWTNEADPTRIQTGPYVETSPADVSAPQSEPNEPTAPLGQNMAPLPHQINPAVWDSLSDTAKQMILAAAGEGKTPSGAWDQADYLRQMYAARPKGQAPTRVTFNWGASQPLF